MNHHKNKSNIKLILGGAQLGLKYGILSKKISDYRIISIIKTAIKNNIFIIDTARGYGNSEKNIGNFIKSNSIPRLRVISKLKSLNNLSSKKNLKEEAKKSLNQTLNNLNTKKINTLLLHKASNLNMSDKVIWKYLINLKKKKIIKKLGVSVQNKEELINALKLKDINVIQLPFNILDNRWDKFIPKIKRTKKNRNLEIHVRSVFLQGLLLNRNRNNWIKTKYNNYRKINKWLILKTRLFGRKSVVDLCLAYVKSQDWIDGIIIGVNNTKQLKDNIMLFNLNKLSVTEINDINFSRPKVNNTLLNPNKWRK